MCLSGDLIPHYYYVPKIYLDAEKKEPHSQVRLPSDEHGDLFLWGQSLLLIMQLLGIYNIIVWRHDTMTSSFFEMKKLYIESCDVLVPSPLKLLYFHELQIQ